jgi:hypothetical protein
MSAMKKVLLFLGLTLFFVIQVILGVLAYSWGPS